MYIKLLNIATIGVPYFSQMGGNVVNYIVQLNEIAISNAHRQTIIIPHGVGEDRIN